MTIRTVAPEELTSYRRTAQQRWQAEQTILAQRQAQAMTVARQAAALLKAEFGATRVLIFGSLAHEQWFSASSDIDLAAWGIEPALYFRAVARLQDISVFSVDLVTMEDCKPNLRAAILVEGKPL